MVFSRYDYFACCFLVVMFNDEDNFDVNLCRLSNSPFLKVTICLLHPVKVSNSEKMCKYRISLGVITVCHPMEEYFIFPVLVEHPESINHFQFTLY